MPPSFSVTNPSDFRSGTFSHPFTYFWTEKCLSFKQTRKSQPPEIRLKNRFKTLPHVFSNATPRKSIPPTRNSHVHGMTHGFHVARAICYALRKDTLQKKNARKKKRSKIDVYHPGKDFSHQNQFCGFQNLAMPKLYGTSKALNRKASNQYKLKYKKYLMFFPCKPTQLHGLDNTSHFAARMHDLTIKTSSTICCQSLYIFCMKLVLIPVVGSLYVFLLRPASPPLDAYFSTLSQPIEIAGMLHAGENSSTLQELSGQDSNQNEIPATFPLQLCGVYMRMFAFMCFFESFEYTTGRQSCNTNSEFKGTDFGRRRRFLLRRFCILQIMGPRSHLDSMWSQFAWDTSDTTKEPRRVARAKDMENFIEELHTGPWHTELRTECTQG